MLKIYEKMKKRLNQNKKNINLIKVRNLRGQLGLKDMQESVLDSDSCPIGVSADLCSAGAPWLRKWSTKFIPITPYTRVANAKLL